jgi:hypothetical protein
MKTFLWGTVASLIFFALVAGWARYSQRSEPDRPVTDDQVWQDR